MQLDAAPQRPAAKVERGEELSAAAALAPREATVTAGENMARRVETLPLVSRMHSMEDSEELIRSVYEARPGVNVTLEERRSQPLARRPEQSRALSEAGERRRATQTAPTVAAPPPAPAVVTWSEGDSRFTLTGPLTREELEQLRQRMP